MKSFHSYIYDKVIKLLQKHLELVFFYFIGAFATLASISTPISSVQKENKFEKAVLEKLKYIPNLSCRQVK